MKTHQYPVDLTDEQIEEFGNELEAIRNEVFDSRGDRDRAYILKVIKTQRTMAVSSRFVIYLSLFFIPAWLWMPAPGSANTQQDIEQKRPSRQWLWLMIAAYSLAGVGYVVSATFVVAILEAMPLLQGKGDWAWVLLGVTAIPSCIFWDKIASRFGETRALIASYVVMLIGIIVPALSSGLILNLLGAALYGATFAGVVSQMLVYIGHQFPLNPAKAMAKLTIGYGVAQIVAPLMAGYISTHTGSYIGALWFAGGAMVLGIACLWKIHRLSN